MSAEFVLKPTPVKPAISKMEIAGKIAELESQKLAAIRCENYYQASLLRDEIAVIKDGDAAILRAARQAAKTK